MVQQQYTGTAYEPSALPLSGEITGWFGRTKARLFGKRDPVEAQLRDIARQGSAGARVSHWFAGALIVLFSLASLVALGADALVAVQAGLAHGTLNVPSAIALGVTALLVPAMDVAMLQAASVIRILATRRAEVAEMRLHITVVIGVSVVEAGTYCYMSYRYEHPADAIAWALIAARALAAPLLSVYLAMARPQPVTSRDILAQVELGAGQGVIRDVTTLANDPDAPLARKMELFAASAVMRPSDATRLDQLIAVAQRPAASSATQQRAVARIVAASSTLPPETPPTEHHISGAADTYKAMHDWQEDDLGDMLDEVEDESDLFSTLVIPAIDGHDRDHDVVDSRPLASADTSGTKRRTRSPKNSGPRNSNLERSKAVRDFNRKLKSDAKAKRRAAIRDAVYSILDAWHANGRNEQISDKELARRVAALVNFDVNPSGNTVARWRGPWQSSRAHKAALLNEIPDDELEPMEPQELRELVATEAW